MSDLGIAGIGAYAPRLRIDAAEFETAWGRFEAPGIESKAVPDADEDALTMAAAAARRALAAVDRDGADLAALWFATTTPPLAEEDLTPRLASLLGAPADVTTHTETGSTRAGAQALVGALAAGVPVEGDAVTLVIASDCPRGAPDSLEDHTAGAGAAAVVVADDGPGSVRDSASAVEPRPGTRFRPAGSEETTGLGVAPYDRAAFTGLFGDAADRLATDPETLDAAAVQSPDGKLPYRAADALGVTADQIAAADTVSRLGDTGAASVLLGLAAAREDGADRVLLAAFGSGAGATLLDCDCAGVPVEAALDGDVNLSYAEYLRRRGEITSGAPEGGGAYVSVPSWQRTAPQRHRLVAGRCSCGALQFPPEGACRDCGNRGAYESVTLPGTGVVEAATTVGQGGAPPEFAEQEARSGPFVSAVVAFDGPDGEEAVSAPVQLLTTGEETPAIGTRVGTLVRLIYEQEGVRRYGLKVRPSAERR